MKLSPRRWLRLRKARAEVILDAKVLQSGYEPGLKHEYDPDDLRELQNSVARLRLLENPEVFA
jgi:hypothetical protein